MRKTSPSVPFPSSLHQHLRVLVLAVRLQVAFLLECSAFTLLGTLLTNERTLNQRVKRVLPAGQQVALKIATVGMILVTESTLIFRVRSWLRMMLVSMLLKPVLACIRFWAVLACESNLGRGALALTTSVLRSALLHRNQHSHSSRLSVCGWWVPSLLPATPFQFFVQGVLTEGTS